MRPYVIDIPESELADLRRRITATRWPPSPLSAGWERGVPLEYLKDLAEYWATDYDWRAAEADVNRYPQFITEIDGASIHFLHVTSPDPNAIPVLITHGWPGSVIEYTHLIRELTRPAPGNGTAAMHLVIPSLPGHGFSGPVPEAGWDVRRVAAAWAELMRRLGYQRYAVAGGDWGTMISLEVARLAPRAVLGAHVSAVHTMPSGDPAEIEALSPSDKSRLDDIGDFHLDLSGYLAVQATRPQTLSYGLTDSPVGQLAWIVEKFKEWNRTAATPETYISRDALLTNASIYWFTGTGGTSTQLYLESGPYVAALFTPGNRPAPVTVPVSVMAFTQDTTPAIRAFAYRDYPTISRWSEVTAGHFATLEHPGLVTTDLQEFITSLAEGDAHARHAG
jgi:microsomal epoxide hydrolase